MLRPCSVGAAVWGSSVAPSCCARGEALSRLLSQLSAQLRLSYGSQRSADARKHQIASPCHHKLKPSSCFLQQEASPGLTALLLAVSPCQRVPARQKGTGCAGLWAQPAAPWGTERGRVAPELQLNAGRGAPGWPPHLEGESWAVAHGVLEAAANSERQVSV